LVKAVAIGKIFPEEIVVYAPQDFCAQRSRPLPESGLNLLSRQHRARLGDALIAQACMDRGVLLLARDRDFCALVDAAGLHIIGETATI